MNPWPPQARAKAAKSGFGNSRYGLAATGEPGVDNVLRLLKDEVDRTLAQIGCPSVSQLSPDYVMADGSMPATALREETDKTIALLGSVSWRDRAEKQSAAGHQR